MFSMPAPRDRAPSEVLRRRRIGIALVACVAVGIVCIFTLRPSEPAYRDKPLSGWVEQLFTFTNSLRVDAEARDALRAMGQPAVRFLTRSVDDAPSAWRLRLASITADIPFLNRLFNFATFDRLFVS